jgi:hypothetical protein
VPATLTTKYLGVGLSAEDEKKLRARTEQLFRQIPDNWTVSIVGAQNNDVWQLNITASDGHRTWERGLHGRDGEHSIEKILDILEQSIIKIAPAAAKASSSS